MILKKKEKKRQYGREHYKNLLGDEKILLLYKGKCKKNFFFYALIIEKYSLDKQKMGNFLFSSFASLFLNFKKNLFKTYYQTVPFP